MTDVYGAYFFSSKGHKITLAIYFVLIWLPRWISSLVFLNGYKDLRTSYVTSWDDIYNNNESTCEADLVSCAKARSFVQAREVEFAHAVLYFLFGLPIIYILIKINNDKNDDVSREPRAKQYEADDN